jgi:hypothetical protein
MYNNTIMYRNPYSMHTAPIAVPIHHLGILERRPIHVSPITTLYGTISISPTSSALATLDIHLRQHVEDVLVTVRSDALGGDALERGGEAGGGVVRAVDFPDPDAGNGVGAVCAETVTSKVNIM